MLSLPIPLLLALCAGPAPCAGSRAPAPGELRVRCVEARTASVYAGACHFGAEATTAGGEALIAWHVESGVAGGTDLAGVDLVAAIAGEGNLAEPGTARRSVVYVSDRASGAQRRAAEALVRERLGAALGSVVAVVSVPVAVETEGDLYRVAAGGLLAIEGRLLADRACCKMPAAVWYRPLAPIERPIVGCNALVRYADERLGRAWERHDENTGFAGALCVGERREARSD